MKSLKCVALPYEGSDEYQGMRYPPTPEHGLSMNGSRIWPMFVDIGARLVERIQQYEYIVGCVAWLTSPPILRALAKAKGVSIVVQKEDFLREDTGDDQSIQSRSRSLRALYDGIQPIPLPFFSKLGQLSAPLRPSQAVRCAGFASERGQTVPRCHHKFAVFCQLQVRSNGNRYIEPVAAWTGSYNWTKNAEASWENAVYIEDRVVASSFFLQWQEIAARSEPLDWTSPDPRPEWTTNETMPEAQSVRSRERQPT